MVWNPCIYTSCKRSCREERSAEEAVNICPHHLVCTDTRARFWCPFSGVTQHYNSVLRLRKHLHFRVSCMSSLNTTAHRDGERERDRQTGKQLDRHSEIQKESDRGEREIKVGRESKSSVDSLEASAVSEVTWYKIAMMIGQRNHVNSES